MSVSDFQIIMTEKNDSDNETRSSANTQSRFAKFEPAHDTDIEESADDDDDIDTADDTDDDFSSKDSTNTDSNTDLITDTDRNTTKSDSEEQVPSDSDANRLWSDATVTDRVDTTNSGSSSDSDTNLENATDNKTDSTISTDSTHHSIESTTDSSEHDSNRMWNQLSRSDAPEEMITTDDRDETSSGKINQTKSSGKATDTNQTQNNSVNADRVDPLIDSRSVSSVNSDTTAESIQTDSSTISEGSQALLLGQNNPETWNVGFNNILQAQQSQNMLLLVPTGEAVDILRVCQEHPGWDGGEIIIIKVGASVPGDMSIAELSGDGMEESIETHQISDQTDLSRLGILITQILDEWQDPNQTTVCSVHTLQAFLQYLGPQKVFQFLHTLSRRLKSADINTNYLMTPSDGDRTINTLRPLFDTVIET